MFPNENHTRPTEGPTEPKTTKGNTMNPDTLHATAEIITATTLAAAAILPYAHRLPPGINKFIQALRNLVPTPRARHRQGRGRHTK